MNFIKNIYTDLFEKHKWKTMTNNEPEKNKFCSSATLTSCFLYGAPTPSSLHYLQCLYTPASDKYQWCRLDLWLNEKATRDHVSVPLRGRKDLGGGGIIFLLQAVNQNTLQIESWRKVPSSLLSSRSMLARSLILPLSSGACSTAWCEYPCPWEGHSCRVGPADWWYSHDYR